MMAPPPKFVLSAFNLAGTPEPLRGGMSATWRVGDTVVKALDVTPEVAIGTAEIVERIEVDGRFRVARPRRARDGRIVVEGWTAWSWLPGRSSSQWREIIMAGEGLHEALSTEPFPRFLESRTDPWWTADRIAWNELPMPAGPGAPPLLAQLIADLPAPERRDRKSQLIHGDLSGNVLMEPGLPPAIIDFSPYWRPPGYASAIVVIDSRWFGSADNDLATWAQARTDHFDELLHRALVFRAVTQWLLRPESLDTSALERFGSLHARNRAP